MLYKALAIVALLVSAIWAAPASTAMDYAVVKNENGKRILLMVGPIERSDAKNFKTAIVNSNGIDGFWLSSGGGNVEVATLIGNEIRRSRMPVAVPSLDRIQRAMPSAAISTSTRSNSNRIIMHVSKLKERRGTNVCASACGILLSSGLLRFVDEPLTVGLHSSYLPPENQEAYFKRHGGMDKGMSKLQQDMQLLGVRAATFMQDMGVNPLYATVAASVPSNCMYWLSASELDALNVVNVQGLKTKGPPGSGLCTCGKDTQLQRQCTANLNRIGR